MFFVAVYNHWHNSIVTHNCNLKLVADVRVKVIEFSICSRESIAGNYEINLHYECS